jgi:hypothetical protein
MSIRVEDPELKKQFKILSYKIKAYGDTKAKLDVYIDNMGDFVMGENNFETIPDRHDIAPSNEIDNYLKKFIENLYEYNEDDRYYDLSIIFDTEKNNLTFNIERNFTKSDSTGHEYDFSDFHDYILKNLKRFEKFKQLNITYDGGGDSGWIDTTIKYKKGTYKMSSQKKKDEELEQWLYELLSDLFGSWGNDEGCSGNIIIDFKQEKVFINHIDYVEATENIDNLLQIDLN